MSTFSEAYRRWEAAEREAREVPSTVTRQAAQQAHFALKHHPAAHKARGKVDRAEERRRQQAGRS